MNGVKVRRKERRRRKIGRTTEANEPVYEFQKTIENIEFSIQPQVTQSLGKLVRRDTYTVLHSKTVTETGLGSTDDLEHESSRNDSTESKNFTYSLDKNPETQNCGTYNVNEPPGENEIRPVPAPRKRKSLNLVEKVSSDTDRDITEIDLDDFRVRSPGSEMKSNQVTNSRQSVNSDSGKSELIEMPTPKPRMTIKHFQKSDSNSANPKNEPPLLSDESLQSKSEEMEEKNVMSESREDSEAEHGSNQLPIITKLEWESKSDEMKKSKMQSKKLIGELFDLKRKRNKSKTLSSLVKLEKKKLPKISSILKDLKEDKDFKPETEEFKTEFEIDSPHYTESAENGQIYVQSKKGFRVMEKNEILRSGNQKKESDENGGMVENSTVKTAVLFQKYWSRSMIYFHGILAGFGFSHAATVTAIMLHYNYEPQGFIGIYSCLSLKIHYAFYTLTALCIISCFDRVDVGHMNRRHWQIAWKIPSMWAILSVYVVSFVLTFSNQLTEARFDAYSNETNETELWNTESQNDIQVGLLQWYHMIWARDVLVLFAWLLISLTKFSDFLHSHISNMSKYSETKEAERSLHDVAGPRGDYK